jgi:hypothetical protein
MKTLIEGHRYELANFEKPENPGQVIQFIHKERVPAGTDAKGVTHPETLVTISDGTTNEEVLEALIDRLEYLFARLQSDHTKRAIQDCRSALANLNARTAERKARGVEGTHKA